MTTMTADKTKRLLDILASVLGSPDTDDTDGANETLDIKLMCQECGYEVVHRTDLSQVVMLAGDIGDYARVGMIELVEKAKAHCEARRHTLIRSEFWVLGKLWTTDDMEPYPLRPLFDKGDVDRDVYRDGSDRKMVLN